MRALVHRHALVGLFVVSACAAQGGGGGSSMGCVPGSTQLCLCAPGSQGVQSCNADGRGYGACLCAGAPDAKVADKAAGSGGGGGPTADGAGDGAATSDTAPDPGGGTADLATFANDASETADFYDWSEIFEDAQAADTGADAAPQGGSDALTGDCPERAMIVYVVTKGNQLLSFTPDKLQFKLVGQLACPVPAGHTPFSMSVDRQANAWVLYTSALGQGGPVMKVSTLDASCQATGYQSGQLKYELFGMGFSSDNPAAVAETLYIGGTSSMSFALNGQCNLGSLDVKTMKVSHIGAIPAALGCPDLSGNGVAELFGFFPQPNPAQVVQLDKATAQPIKSWPLPAGSFADVQAWAFAQWGGKFWLFFQGIGAPTSAVWALDPASGQAAKVIAQTGHTITGAGVSSCAPTKAP